MLMNTRSVEMEIQVNLKLLDDGSIDIKSTTQDVATIILVMEKAKFEMLKKIQIMKKTSLLAPGLVN